MYSPEFNLFVDRVTAVALFIGRGLTVYGLVSFISDLLWLAGVL